MGPLGVEFSDTVSLGAIITVLFAAALALIFTIRSHSATTWKDNYEAEKVRREAEREKKHAALAELAALRLVKDVTPLLEQQQQLMARLVKVQEDGEARYGHAIHDVREMFREHEEKAQDRHEAQIVALRAIAARLDGTHV